MIDYDVIRSAIETAIREAREEIEIPDYGDGLVIGIEVTITEALALARLVAAAKAAEEPARAGRRAAAGRRKSGRSKP